MKILIAEDDPTSRYMLEKTLKYWGYETTTVKDGALAMMFLFTEDHPDILLLDWEMPKIEGVRICERVRGDEKLRNLYLILLTARSSKEDMLEGYRSGADDFLTKPVSVADLKTAVDKAADIVNKKIPLIGRKEIRLDNVNMYLQRNGLPLL